MTSSSNQIRLVGAVTVIFGTALLAACASFKPTLRADFDRATNFSTYSTYGYVEPVATDKAGYSSLITQHFKQAVDAEMSARGYRKVTDNPELLVNFMANAEEKVDMRSTPVPSMSVGMGYYRYRRDLYLGIGVPLYTSTPQVESVRYKVGTANVELIDAKQRRLVWEGIAEGRLSKKVMDNPQPAIAGVVKQLFEKYPGRAAGN